MEDIAEGMKRRREFLSREPGQPCEPGPLEHGKTSLRDRLRSSSLFLAFQKFV